MANPQLHPLELNPLTKEPFLRLLNHKNIIITPPRPSDVACYPLILNDPRVYEWLIGPPIPYLHEYGETWYAIVKAPIDTVLAELDAAKDKADLITVDTCPVRAIREILDNGEEVYLGDIGFDRLEEKILFAPLDIGVNEELVSRYVAENTERVVGDPDIVWTFGDYLVPSHHGQGIMSDAVKTVLYDWAVPRMNARRIISSVLRGNQASLNSLTNEPFLRLRNHRNIIITPPRPSDIACYPLILNDPRVYEQLIGPPNPYLHEHAEAWFGTIKAPIDAVLKELDAAKDKADLITVDICPVRAIREILDNGEEVYLGDICFTRFRDGRLLAPLDIEVDKELVSRYAAENTERMVGDPEIVWMFGDYLAPSHHGQGIMTDAVKTVLYGWAVPRMNARRVITSVLRGNQASVRVFQKNGFHLKGLQENFLEARGQMYDAHILEWHLDDRDVS